VTVIDPQTHMPAAGATVDAKLGQIDTQGAPALHQQGSQFLCTQSADPTARRCGTDLSGLTTDQERFRSELGPDVGPGRSPRTPAR
jgi:hypothetical protein